MPSLIDIALEVAEEYPVFACNADKRPCLTGGFYNATQDPDEIERQFSLPNAAMIGVPTGKPSGLVAIDVDVKDGKRGKDWLEQNREFVGKTRRHRTKSGGWHFIFKLNGYDPGTSSRSRAT